MIYILENGFYPNYCLENWLALDKKLRNIGIPMICLSDIPEKFMGPHKKKYGPYGLSMLKDWAILNNITPITYIHKKSPNLGSLRKLIKLYNENYDSIHAMDFIRNEDEPIFGPSKNYTPYGICYNLENTFYQLHFLFKLYTSDDFLETNVCFYDEREWRYYPPNIKPAFLEMTSYYQDAKDKFVIYEHEYIG